MRTSEVAEGKDINSGPRVPNEPLWRGGGYVM
jgi:hypothetical protein